MSPEILKIIEAQLPAAVGSVLKQRLATIETLEATNKRLVAEAAALESTAASLRKQLAEHAAITTRETAVLGREQLVTKREMTCSLIEVRLECADLRIKDLKEVTQTVFANSRFKYSESGMMPVGMPSGGYVSSGAVSKHIEAEQ